MEKKLNTRVKIDCRTFAEWEQANPIAQKGEIMIVESPMIVGDSTKSEYLMKIGDGVTDFHNLEYISAKSADVYPWALAPEKPKYTASEIEGLNIDGNVADYTLLENLPSINGQELIEDKDSEALKLLGTNDSIFLRGFKGIYSAYTAEDFKKLLIDETGIGHTLTQYTDTFIDENGSEFNKTIQDFIFIYISPPRQTYITINVTNEDNTAHKLNGKYYRGLYLYRATSTNIAVSGAIQPIIENNIIKNIINDYQIATLNPMFDSINENIVNLQNKDTTIETSIEEINTNLSTINEKIPQIETNSNNIAAINEKVTNNIAAIDNNTNSINTLNGEITSLKENKEDKITYNFISKTTEITIKAHNNNCYKVLGVLDSTNTLNIDNDFLSSEAGNMQGEPYYQYERDTMYELTFCTGETAPTLTYLTGDHSSNGIIFTGDSVKDRIFIPQPKTNYDIIIWFDAYTGSRTGIVHGYIDRWR